MSVSVARSSAYKKKTLLEHVLLRAETYVGSKEPETMTLYIPGNDEETKKTKMMSRDVTFVPAFFKIFDEIIVNAADNKVRDHSTDTIKVTIDAEKGEISVWNNGKGIPVVMHEEERIYVPEMIFGHLLTGSNYDDDEKRVTGGRNGYGAKLTNIYSTEFHLETHDSIEGKTYKQKWSDNMSKIYPAKITSKRDKDYTKVTFKPDFHKLNMTEINDDTLAVLTKRVYDLTGSLPGVKVFLNKDLIKIKSFKDYISTYLVSELEEKPKFVHERMNNRWEVAVALSETGTFQHVSFVNSIATTKGGTHVNYITDQVVAYITEQLKKKDSKITVKPAQVKNQLFIFVNCLIENPQFEGQVKETMTLRVNKYGSTCLLPDAFLKRIGKLGIVESTLDIVRGKEEAQLKKSDGSKRSRLSGIVKLNDANDAGTRKSKDCTLFLVEGDSALSFALSGIPVVEHGRDKYGAFPLRGKLLNVREASTKQKLDNTEITQLKQILGLKEEKAKTYTSVDTLRYGHICILVDSDHDGKHIKGLILNWLESSFPSLLKIPGFVLDFKSPIVKCTKDKKDVLFYTLRDYEDWKRKETSKGWTITYFKGLATSEEKDVKRYFKAIDKHLTTFAPLREEDSERLDLAFSKKRPDDRKQWLQGYSKDIFLDDTLTEVTISDFIDKDFIEFSMYDNIRSIPSVVDGLKPGQRKILYTAFKTNLKNKIKVAQFSGEVSKSTEYRHGEQSLNMTIVGMAQWFVGANNVALLYPSGGFGTRRQGGSDAGSPRYIYTYLQQTTRDVFPPHDDAILNYQIEDGFVIEPNYYVPVIPMVLVNGADGIGTGYSTSVLCYNPMELADILLKRTTGEIEYDDLVPWYRGFNGDIVQSESGKWTFYGKIRKISETVLEVTELPIHTWTEKYKEFLEKLIACEDVKDYKEYHTNTQVKFVITTSAEKMKGLCSGDKSQEENLLKNMKLVVTKNSTNMMLFDSNEKLKKYDTVGDIIEEFYSVRISYYQKRKGYLLEKLRHDLNIMTNKVKFVTGILDGTIVLNNKKKDVIYDLLESKHFYKLDDSFTYLLSMPLQSLQEERIIQLRNDMIKSQKEYDELYTTSPEKLFQNDLHNLKVGLNKYEEIWKEAQSDDIDEDESKGIKTKRKSTKENGNGSSNKTKKVKN